MKKIFFKLSFLFLLFGLASLIYPAKSFAQPPFDCGFTVSADPADNQLSTTQIIRGVTSLTYNFDLSKVDWSYFPTNPDGTPTMFNKPLVMWGDLFACPLEQYSGTLTTTSKISYKRDSGSFTTCTIFNDGDHSIHLQYYDEYAWNKYSDLCKPGQYTILEDKHVDIYVDPENNAPPDVNATWAVKIENVKWYSWLIKADKFAVDLDTNNLNNESAPGVYLLDKGNLGNIITYNKVGDNVHFTLNKLPEGPHRIDVLIPSLLGGSGGFYLIGSKTFTVYRTGHAPTATPIPSPTVPPPPGTTYTPIPPIPSLAPICDQIDSKYQATCWNCINQGKLWTAIGCIPTNIESILKDYVFVYGTGIAGGIAFLYFLYGVFLILTSAGNAEKIAEGKEIIISALSGLFLIIFSVFLLRVIGYDILKIPGFS